MDTIEEILDTTEECLDDKHAELKTIQNQSNTNVKEPFQKENTVKEPKQYEELSQSVPGQLLCQSRDYSGPFYTDQQLTCDYEVEDRKGLEEHMVSEQLDCTGQDGQMTVSSRTSEEQQSDRLQLQDWDKRRQTQSSGNTGHTTEYRIEMDKSSEHKLGLTIYLDRKWVFRSNRAVKGSLYSSCANRRCKARIIADYEKYTDTYPGTSRTSTTTLQRWTKS
jgi:hypothetical protein